MTVTLFMSMSGLVHRNGCYALKRIYKIVAPELPEAEIPAFLEARKLARCGACLPERSS